MPMVKLFSAEDAIEAHLLRHMLEQQGIGVFITGEHLEGAVGEMPAGGGLVDVWVLDEQLPDAQDVLDDFLDNLEGPYEEDDEALLDDDGYYRDDLVEDEEPAPPAPARTDPANPWNTVYRKRRANTRDDD